MSDGELNTKLRAAPEKFVGKAALTRKYGLDCFALSDKLLRQRSAAPSEGGSTRLPRPLGAAVRGPGIGRVA